MKKILSAIILIIFTILSSGIGSELRTKNYELRTGKALRPIAHHLARAKSSSAGDQRFSIFKGKFRNKIIVERINQRMGEPVQVLLDVTEISDIPKKQRRAVLECFNVWAAYGDKYMHTEIARYVKAAWFPRETDERIPPNLRIYLAISQPEQNGTDSIFVEGFAAASDNTFNSDAFVAHLPIGVVITPIEVYMPNRKKEEDFHRFIGVGTELLWAVANIELGNLKPNQHMTFHVSHFDNEGIVRGVGYRSAEVRSLAYVRSLKTCGIISEQSARNIITDLTLENRSTLPLLPSAETIKRQAEELMGADEFKLRYDTFGKGKEAAGAIASAFIDDEVIAVSACHQCGRVLGLKHDYQVPSLSHGICFECGDQLYPGSLKDFERLRYKEALKFRLIEHYVAAKASSAGTDSLLAEGELVFKHTFRGQDIDDLARAEELLDADNWRAYRLAVEHMQSLGFAPDNGKLYS